MKRVALLLVIAGLIVFGPALAFAQDQPSAEGKRLPKVVLVGDSIRLSYAEAVSRQLAGKAVVVSPKANGGDSSNVLKHLDAWVIREQPDIVHFNCGIHDTKKFTKTGKFQVSPEQYEANLRSIVKRIREETDAVVLFATTTPILNDRAAAARKGRDYVLLGESVTQYNEIAVKVMHDLNVPINDLHTTLSKPKAPVTLETMIGGDGVHLTPQGRELAGSTVAGFISEHLGRQETTSLPSHDVFLLPYFLGNGETGVYFAYSHDGLKFDWLNDGKVVLPAPQWSEESLTRDPSIVYHDGRFHMIWTTSWNSRSIGYSTSKDLASWSEPVKIDIWGDFTEVRNTWAPELHWDPIRREFLLLWSSTTLAELNDGDGSEDKHGYDHRSYASRTRDFRSFTKPRLFFSPRDPEYSVIDPFIAHDDRNTEDSADDRWIMVIKHELSAERGGKNLRLTFSSNMQGPYDTTLSSPIVGAGTDIVNQMGEGPSLFKRAGLWFLYWDAPGSEFSYCLATSPDLKNWTNRSSEMSLPAKQMRHGTVLVVPKSAVSALR